MTSLLFFVSVKRGHVYVQKSLFARRKFEKTRLICRFKVLKNHSFNAFGWIFRNSKIFRKNIKKCPRRLYKSKEQSII